MTLLGPKTLQAEYSAMKVNMTDHLTIQFVNQISPIDVDGQLSLDVTQMVFTRIQIINNFIVHVRMSDAALIKFSRVEQVECSVEESNKIRNHMQYYRVWDEYDKEE